MKAGRELDKLIGEKVFELDGWYLVDEFLPHYSTNIADAWLVVEKLHDKGFLFEIQNSVGAGYSVRFYDSATAKIYSSHYQDTAPLAICLTALKAVGYEK